MRKKLFGKKLAAYVCAAAMVFCGFAGVSVANTTPVVAAETEIQLDDAASGMNKTLHIDKAAKDAKDGVSYAYQGFVTFKDVATKDFKYLKLTYTGDITNLRFEFNEKTSNTNQGPFWFDAEQDTHFVTADGSEIPLVGDNTTIVIDLEASGVDMSKYNNGIHMHGNSTTDAAFDVTLKDGVLSSVAPGGTSGGSDNESDNGGDGDDNSRSAANTPGGSNGTSNGTPSSTNAPSTGEATWPIAAGVGGILVAGVAFAISRSKKFKED